MTIRYWITPSKVCRRMLSATSVRDRSPIGYWWAVHGLPSYGRADRLLMCSVFTRGDRSYISRSRRHLACASGDCLSRLQGRRDKTGKDLLSSGSRLRLQFSAVCSSAESDAGEHPFEHGKERLVGVSPARAGPGEQGGFADRDYGEPRKIFRIKSVTGFLVIGGIGATDGAVEEPVGASGRVQGRGHQRCRMPVNGDLDHV